MIRLIEAKLDWKKKHGIKPEGVGLGFSEKEQKWYGWSHRSRFGWGIGDKYEEGDCGFDTFKVSGKSFTCKTLDDCKRVAKHFSRSVS